MSSAHGYRAVGWNRQKRIYDLTVTFGVLGYLALFVAGGALLRPQATIETLLIRALGTAALLLLTILLSIGPLSRIDRRFLPLLYNRRHLGVTMFLLALGHGGFSLVQFHALGEVNPLVSVLSGHGDYATLSRFPFQPLGLAALTILFLMASTSHDFWLANLTPPVWKTLHMAVYLAFGLIILHVALGVLQAESNPWLAALVTAAAVWVPALHVVAARREAALDREGGSDPAADGFVRIGRFDEIPEKRAKIVCLSGERVAVFRYDGKVSALSNVCQHQNGPLGEGCIRDGLVTCPWHGFQYRPEDGSSPPPFSERVPTFDVRLEGGEVWVHPRPHRAGTRVEPAEVAS